MPEKIHFWACALEFSKYIETIECFKATKRLPLNTMNSRRNFLLKLALSAGTPALMCGKALAQAPPVKLEENDPVATALGYKEDTTKVDAAKYPMHKPEQRCDGCALYILKAGEVTGPCSAFGGKLVTAAGWCAAFVKTPTPAN